MSTYHQPTLSNFRAEKGYYTTRELAEIYHVTPQTISNWIRRGWIKGEMYEPISPKAKTMRGRWRVNPQEVEDIELYKDELIEASRKYWVRLLVQIKKGK